MFRRRAPALFVAALAAGVLLWLFAPVWFGGQSFAFRDAAYYYHPLFRWTAAEWGAGRVPLWNPQENCGVPVLADTTSSVFYPGKLLFALPLGFETNYVLYITGHVALAAAAAYLLARRWRASVPAAGIAAFSYAFGGNVLFQCCNVVFLVSAAWLPLALLAIDRTLVRRSAVWAVAFGATLALMTLGGDPQTAYNAGLAAVLYAVLLWWRGRRSQGERRRETAHRAPLWRRLAANRFTLLALAAASGTALAAVQILPGVEWSRLSDRAAYSRPRSVYEAAQYVVRRGAERKGTLSAAAEGLLGQPVQGAHQRDIYDFSISPWQAAELVWPNISGTSYPLNRRWSAAIPGADRVWTPSLYMGLLPLLLALAAWRLRRGPLRVRWLSWLALLFAIGSLGWYGIGWLLHELLYPVVRRGEHEAFCGFPVGGLYWLMVVLLPGYAYFRYPAKLLVFAAIALSLLAARGCDRLLTPLPASREANRGRWTRRLTLGLAIASCVLAAATLVFRAWFVAWLSRTPADDLFGPLDAAGAANVVLFAFAQTALLGFAGRLLFALSRAKPSPLWKHAALAMAAVDLVVAHGWFVASAPREIWNTPSQLGRELARLADADQTGNTGPAFSRIHRALPDRWTPPSWSRASSPARLAEEIAWSRDTLLPKYHLRDGHSLVEAHGTMASHDYRVLLNIAREYGVSRPDGLLEPHPGVLRALSANYLILPRGFDYPDTLPIAADGEPDDELEDARLVRLVGAFPRAWIVHEIELMRPLTSDEPAVVGRRTREVLFPGLARRDLSKTAVVEREGATAAMRSLLPSANAATLHGEVVAAETCRIARDEPQHVEVEVEARQPGLLVLSDLYYPGWQAELHSEGAAEPRSLEIVRANRIMRGVVVPKGRHRIVFTYRPTLFFWGAVISSLAWLALATVGAGWLALPVVRRSSRRSSTRAPGKQRGARVRSADRTKA